MRDARTQHLPQDDADGQAARGYPSGVDASLARYRGSATPGYSWGTALRFGKMEKLQSTGLRHRNLLSSTQGHCALPTSRFAPHLITPL
jgi:hypothetical protein